MSQSVVPAKVLDRHEEGDMSEAKGRGLVVSSAFESYKTLRQRELALHRLAVEVVAMHSSSSLGGCEGMSKAHRRLLEDIRDLCNIDPSLTEAEVLAADSCPQVEEVRKSGVAHHREPHYDGVDDVPLDRAEFIAISNIVEGDDSIVQMVPTPSSSGGKKRPTVHTNGGGSSKASLGQASGADATSSSSAADPTYVYLKEVKVVEKGILELCKEAVSSQTTAGRIVEIREQLKAKREQLVSMKDMIERDTR